MVKTSTLGKVCQASLLAFTLVLSSVSTSAVAAPAVAETISIASAINKAGRQRMLSQRMVKAYCQLHLGVKPELSKKILQDSIILFETQLVELRFAASNPALQQAWTAENNNWTKMRPLLMETPSDAGARKLHELNEPLLASAHKLTVLFDEESGKKAGYWINVAGRQRMLSQRIAKFYMLKKMGLTGLEIDEGLAKAKSEFISAHEALIGGAANNPHIQAELRLAKNQWNYLNIALLSDDDNDADHMSNMESVATTSERILSIMNDVTAMFEEAYGS
ncbi:MAG: type IV pili methyl-accepting chemotaxis transducer N-terminal domain-containing protein [Gallionella sp.]|nr:type IV pili methyl-accepting chemotaxis transducer N-terminal domain-containing protein [Gallionella sp.]MDD4959453.1 type IV pili methyl-accepting chemotaxis transducer N-terminal domain-containing protein [Gallionella sp.]